jgi:signal transduction histidine kinase
VVKIKSPSESILIAEDSITQAEILSHILKEAGYRVQIAKTGKEALSFIKQEMPDILLTDIVMPEMDGYELCRTIKTDPLISALPVILVTQLSDPEDVIRGLASGANNFIIKPYDKERMLYLIRSVVRNLSDIQNDSELGIEYNQTRYQVLSEKNDILQILLSIYDTAVFKNLELEQATMRLNHLTENLEQLVEERTEALKKTAGTVKQLLMQKNDIISKIGHDLNTPLTPLVALLPYVLKHEKDPELKEILQVLVNDVSRLKGHIEQITKLSLLNQESFSMSEREIHVKRVIDDVITGYEFSIKQLDILVHNYIPADYTITLSPFHATTIFENLISNAIKYNIRGGTISFKITEEGNDAVIWVSDTGIGLSQEEAEHVFDEFYKADSSRHDHDSHGLGLTIVHKILTLCGGSIRLISQGKGMGSTFQVRIPRYH